MDLVLFLVQALLAAGDPAAAERLVEEVLAPRAEPDLVAAAREEIERSELLSEARRALGEGRPRDGLRLLDEAASITSNPVLRERLEAEADRLRRGS